MKRTAAILAAMALVGCPGSREPAVQDAAAESPHLVYADRGVSDSPVQPADGVLPDVDSATDSGRPPPQDSATKPTDQGVDLPAVACDPPACGGSPTACGCQWSCADGYTYNTTCSSSAGGWSCTCAGRESSANCEIEGSPADPCYEDSCCGFPK